jgi:hypothetical protein
MFPADCTVAGAVGLLMLAEVVAALIVAVPTETPVTGTVALVAPAAMVTVAGTVTKPVGEALIFTVRAAGKGADKFSVRFCVDTPEIVMLGGVKLSVALLCTVWTVVP